MNVFEIICVGTAVTAVLGAITMTAAFRYREAKLRMQYEFARSRSRG